MMLVEALKTCAFSFDGIHVTKVEQGDIYELDDRHAKTAIRYDKGRWFRLYDEDNVEEEKEDEPESTLKPKTSKTDVSGNRKGKDKTSSKSRNAKGRKTAIKKD